MTKRTKKGRKIKDLWNRLVKGRKPPLEEQLRKQQIKEIRSLLSIGKTEKVADKLKENPQNIFVVVESLSDENSMFREYPASALGDAAEKGVDISDAIEALVKALTDYESGGDAAWALGAAAANEKSSQKALEALVKASTDENRDVRNNAVKGLGHAAWREVDITDVVGVLVKALTDKDSLVRRCAAWALGRTATNEKTREAAVREMLNFMDSSWFMREAEKNSDAFIDVVNELDTALREVKEEERKVA